MKRIGLLLVVMTLLVSGGLVGVPKTAQATGAQTTVFWSAQYYNNVNFTGTPTATATVNNPGGIWEQGSPDATIPNDHWAARWTSTQTLNAGTYTLRVRADDGVRVWIDGVLYLNEWHQAAGITYQVNVNLTQGNHTVVVEYYEATGAAFLEYSMTLASAAPTPGTPGQPTVTNAAVIINTSSLRVRSLPSLSGAVLTRVYYGQQYPIVGRTSDNRWWQISVNGTVGWVSGSYVNAFNTGSVPVTAGGGTTPTSPTTTLLAAYTLQINASFLNMRQGPGTGFPVITALPRNTVGQIIGRDASGGWWKINVNGLVGWVGARYVIVGSGTDINQVPLLTQ